jgi:ectoine hydroxylase-related dioxygenase (phytanoyl-CoA dioxygenase family)
MTNMTNITNLTSEYILTPEHRRYFQENGHICLRGVCTPDEIRAWQPTIQTAALRYNTQQAPLEERSEYGKAFLQVTNLWKKEPEIAPFTLAPRFANIAAYLLGIESVCLYHDQALFKEPGGSPTHWHQDQTYMPFDTPNLIGIWIPLVPISEEVGSMSFVTGSHKLGWLGDMPWSSEASEKVEDICRKHYLEMTTYGAMELGDVTLHSAWTLHSAQGNPTQNVREIMNIFYVGADTIIQEPMSTTHAVGFHNLEGKGVGDRVESPTNPRL